MSESVMTKSATVKIDTGSAPLDLLTYRNRPVGGSPTAVGEPSCFGTTYGEVREESSSIQYKGEGGKGKRFGTIFILDRRRVRFERRP